MSWNLFVRAQQEGQFDLLFDVFDIDESILGALRYDTDLFDAPTIARMLGHFQTLLASVSANPDQTVALLPILTDTERHQLLVEWNDTEKEYPRDRCVHELFEMQVELTPDAVAVLSEERHLTYRELNRRSNQLAHYLRMLGVGPEVLVGICVERSRGNGGGNPWYPQGWRRLRAFGPGLSSGASGLHARRRAGRCVIDAATVVGAIGGASIAARTGDLS